MATFPRPFNIDFAIKSVDTIVLRKLIAVVDPKWKASVIIFLLQEMAAITPQLISSADQLYNTLWLKLREADTVVFNFVMEATSEMMMRFKSQGWDNKMVSEFFIETVPINGGNSEHMDKLALGMMVTTDAAKTLFTDNSWYIFAVILTMTDFKSSTVESLTDSEKPGGKSK